MAYFMAGVIMVLSMVKYSGTALAQRQPLIPVTNPIIEPLRMFPYITR